MKSFHLLCFVCQNNSEREYSKVKLLTSTKNCSGFHCCAYSTVTD
jgi:hypothetical protein